MYERQPHTPHLLPALAAFAGDGRSATTSSGTNGATSGGHLTPLKQWRELATRYDKHAPTYRAGRSDSVTSRSATSATTMSIWM